jgi:hypothetical protein
MKGERVMGKVAFVIAVVALAMGIYLNLPDHKISKIESNSGAWLTSEFQEDEISYYKITSTIISVPEVKDGKCRLNAKLPLRFSRLEVRSCNKLGDEELCSEAVYFNIGSPEAVKLQIN